MHHVTRFIILQVLSVIYQLGDVASVAPGSLRYDIVEEQPVGTKVGDVSESLRQLIPRSNVHFSLSPPNQFVNIDPLSGVVRSSVVLDRETLCTMAFDTDCLLDPVTVNG
jgi:Cadherin-like